MWRRRSNHGACSCPSDRFRSLSSIKDCHHMRECKWNDHILLCTGIEWLWTGSVMSRKETLLTQQDFTFTCIYTDSDFRAASVSVHSWIKEMYMVDLIDWLNRLRTFLLGCLSAFPFDPHKTKTVGILNKMCVQCVCVYLYLLHYVFLLNYMSD